MAIFTLALGIGVNTAMFSIVNGIMLRGLPFPEQRRVVALSTTVAGEPNNRSRLSWDEFTDLPVYFAQTMDQRLTEAAGSKKLIAWLFGVVADGLAGIGLYGVMSYAVSQRTQEIGVRVALGATPGNILALVFRQGRGPGARGGVFRRPGA